MENNLINDSFAFNRSTNSSLGPSVDLLNLVFFWLMILCNIGNVLAIIGIMSVHSKLFKIESFSLLLICITHFVCLIIFTLANHICYLDILGYVLHIFHLFLLVMISLNRTYVIYLSFVQKKQVMVAKKHKVSLFKRYKSPTIIALGGFLTIFIAFYVPFLIKNEKAFDENCADRVSRIYSLFLRSYTTLFLNVVILINYLIVIPYLMIRYSNRNIRNHRSTINSILRLFIYSLTNLISFTLYAFLQIFQNNQLLVRGNSSNQVLSISSHIFYNLEPFILLITHSKILTGLFKSFGKLRNKKF